MIVAHDRGLTFLSHYCSSGNKFNSKIRGTICEGRMPERTAAEITRQRWRGKQLNY